ncbi:Ig-like domain-containing protein [Brachymonas sp. G13]|uniref:Ig-like domain-containing protein n=1 Tax=Brachymonas wangyanguii TaxID=3130163 RepID=UPI0038699ECC
MSLKHITLRINNATETILTRKIDGGEGGVGSQDKAVHIQAQANVHYHFTDEATGFGPENIATKRVGKNLHVAFEGGDVNEPDLVIENYYKDNGEIGYESGTNNMLVGTHENGNVYPYVPESAETTDAVSMLGDGVEAGQALGGEGAVVVPFFWWPALLGVGLLGAAAGGGGGGGAAPVPAKPLITVDAPDNTPDTTPTITGTTDAPVGSTVTVVVKDSAGGTQTVTTTVQPDGTYSVDVPKALPEGGYTATATVKDPAGNTGMATDPGSVDTTAPAITVDAPDNTTDTTPTITGTTDAPVGSTVTVVVKDSAGGTQTVTTTVQPDGTYSVDVPKALPEGGYTATATVKDPAGNTGMATDPGSVDTTAPAITVDAPDNTTDTTPTITGTTDAPVGSTVTVVVKDSAGGTQTVTTTVQPDGTYSVDVPKALPEGGYTATATVKDPAGNTGMATDPGSVDTTAPAITVDAPDNTTDTTPTITGTTDAPVGSTVTVVVKDSAGGTQTVTTTVQPGGTYSVEVPKALPEGGYTATATVQDPAGNIASASDFVDSPETVTTDEDTPVSGSVLDGTTSVDGPVTVTEFTVGGTTYQAGETATITGVGTIVVNADGTYTFTPNDNWNGTVPSVGYTVTDGSSTDTSKLDITVTPVDDPFTDADETVTTDEDTPVSGSVLDGTTSVDGPVTVTEFTVGGTTYQAGETATITGVGTIVVNADGTYTFTPNDNWNGTVPSVGYTVTDGSSTDTSKLDITVTPVDDPFTDADETVTTDEDTPVSGSVLDGTTSVDGPW